MREPLARRAGRIEHALAGLCVLLLTACIPARIEPAPSAPVALAVVTWNMHAGRGDLPRLLRDVQTGRVTGMPPRDVVFLLQEFIDGRSGTDVNWSAVFFPVRTDHERASGNAILSTRPLLDAHSIELPRQRQRRLAVAATIDVDGQRLFVVSAHLENRVSWLQGGLLSDSARGRQAEALLRALPASAPGILGGDMNTWLGTREPTWRAFAQRFDDTPRDPSPPTFRDRLVLDHLFFDVPDGWRVSRRVLEDTYHSDHHPVVGMVFNGEGTR